MEDYNLVLPIRVDKKPNGKISEPAGIGEPGYIENSECHLQIIFCEDRAIIYYYCDDDTELNKRQFQEVVNMHNKKPPQAGA